MVRLLWCAAVVGILVLTPVGSSSASALTASGESFAPTLRTPLVAELPSTGSPRLPVIVIDFPDQPSTLSTRAIDSVVFGVGDARRAPFESLRSFYLRSSYGKLDLRGDVLGVYRATQPRAELTGSDVQTRLVSEALQAFDEAGADFSRYDADEDGRIDYLIVLWTGPAKRGGVWWGSYTGGGSAVVVDGTRLGAYSWQGVPMDGSARTLVHETGHALGLSDLYDANPAVGPGGGVGAFDPMGDGSCDLNALSKIMLGWIVPRVVSAGVADLVLRPTSDAPDAAIVMPSFSMAAPYGEFYVVQARRRSGNDAAWPYETTSGLQVWHVDATLATTGRYRYNNSSSAHRFLSVVQADGLREIETLDMSNSADLFHTGGEFSERSAAGNELHSGATSGVTLNNVRCGADSVRVSAGALPPKAVRTRNARAARARTVAAARRLAAVRR